MRNRKNHPNNNYLGNMTFKSACPGIKRGRHLHSLKIVEIFHIELIWNIQAFTTGLSWLSLCLGIGSLPPSVFLSLFPSVSTGTTDPVSPHPSGSSVLAWPLSVCFPFLGFLCLLGCRRATSLMIGDASLFGVHSLSLTAIVSTFQVLAFVCHVFRIVTLTCLLFYVTDYT
jgi:hypothetical protein